MLCYTGTTCIDIMICLDSDHTTHIDVIQFSVWGSCFIFVYFFFIPRDVIFATFDGQQMHQRPNRRSHSKGKWI